MIYSSACDQKNTSREVEGCECYRVCPDELKSLDLALMIRVYKDFGQGMVSLSLILVPADLFIFVIMPFCLY